MRLSKSNISLNSNDAVIDSYSPKVIPSSPAVKEFLSNRPPPIWSQIPPPPALAIASTPDKLQKRSTVIKNVHVSADAPILTKPDNGHRQSVKTSSQMPNPSTLAFQATPAVDSVSYARELIEAVSPGSQVISTEAIFSTPTKSPAVSESQPAAISLKSPPPVVNYSTKPSLRHKNKLKLIKVAEVYDEKSDLDHHDERYLTISNGHNAEELLTLALRKWRYLDPRLAVDIIDMRPIITEKIRSFIDEEGWQLVLIKKLDGQPDQYQPLSTEVLSKVIDFTALEDVTNNLGSDDKLDSRPADIGIRKTNNDSKLTVDYHKSELFHSCQLLKLDSRYPMNRLQSIHEIDSQNWASRYVVLAKNRYLLFFKSRNHARWVQNVLHEIDFARVSAVQKANIRVTDDRVMNLSPGQNFVARYSIKIFTRSRIVVLAVKSLDEQERIIEQLNDVITDVSMRKDKIRHSLVDNLAAKPKSESPLEPSESPQTKLITKLETTVNLNDIDLPPFDSIDEWANWSTATNSSVLSNMRQVAARHLQAIFQAVDSQVSEQLDIFLAASRNENRLLSETKTSAGSYGTLKSMKRLFKGLQQYSPTSSTASLPDRTSSLFGISLETLSARYDTTGYGIPTLPPVAVQSMEYLRSNGLHVSGLFRVAGSVKRVDLLRKEFEALDMDNDKSKLMDFSQFNVHDVAGVLKLFLRELPDPLLTTKLYRIFLAVEKLKANESDQVAALKYLMMLLPGSHRLCLQQLLLLLNDVADNSEDQTDPTTDVVEKGNLMTPQNLAVCIGPNILRECKPANIGESKSGSLVHSRSQSAQANTNNMEFGGVVADEFVESAIVVNIVRLLIVHHRQLFTLDKETISDLKKAPMFTMRK